MIAVVLLSMLNPFMVIGGFVCGAVIALRVIIGTIILICAAYVLTIGLIPIMIPSALMALAAWTAIGWFVVWGFRRFLKSRNTSPEPQVEL